MILSSKNVQTTAYPRFRAQRQTDPNFNMSGGCCNKNRNPIIGWRKESNCCGKDPVNNNTNKGWQQVFTNVDSCCKSYNRMIQNRAASSPAQTAANGGVAYRVSGKVDRNYNHNYRQYLKKRCMVPDSDTRKSAAYVFDFGHGSIHVGQKPCCTTDCSEGTTVATYKRSNWGFRKQGAVDNDIYISKKVTVALNSNALFGNQPCPCPPCICEQILQAGVTLGGAVVGSTATGGGSGATGIVISITGSAPSERVTVKLDDCNDPFTTADTNDITFNPGVTATIITVEASSQDCDDDVPRPPRYPPQYPAYDPKSFNHGKFVLPTNI